ncbi:TolC family protein [Pontibacter actiniarum]|uniref:Transporter n=1 Tax=Pontibacter actiniarum TaxID=323450 RepID=A0A1X9YX74_9BACT|nr:TolC family protein [Pontibacter actiniarum]ARS37550.1 hypothetical protein CA264_20145 [Pontibacter actiniarum]
MPKPFRISFIKHSRRGLRLIRQRLCSCFILVLAAANVAAAQDIRTLSLQEAQDLALEQNRLLRIAREQVEESEQKVKEAQSRQYPLVYATGGYTYNGVTEDVVLPMGALGVYPNSNIFVPQTDIPILESKHNLIMASALAMQPITQLGKIRTGVKIAQTDVKIAEAKAAQAAQEVKQGVEQLFYGLLLAQKQQEEAQANIQLTEAKLYDVESALLAGKTDEVNKIGLQAALADEQQKLLVIQHQVADYTYDLNQLLGLPTDTGLRLDGVQEEEVPLQPLEEYLQLAQTVSYDVRIAEHTSQKAAYGVNAAKKDYIPNVNAIGGYTHQSILNVLPENNYFFGVQANWNIIDFGRRKAVLKQRQSQQRQAELNLENTREDVTGRVEQAYRKVQQARQLVAVARQAVQYREQELKLKQDRFDAGLILKKDVLESQAALAKSEADLYAARLGYRLALSDLQAMTGASAQEAIEQ